MSKTQQQNENRATARIKPETKKKLEVISNRIGISESDLIRIGLEKTLADIESGSFDPLRPLKKAA